MSPSPSRALGPAATRDEMADHAAPGSRSAFAAAVSFTNTKPAGGDAAAALAAALAAARDAGGDAEAEAAPAVAKARGLATTI